MTSSLPVSLGSSVRVASPAARTEADGQFYERYWGNLDRQIDEIVYRLYDITPEERKIIEGA